MESKNCKHCNYFDDINRQDKTIFCYVWRKRVKSDEPCEQWTEYVRGMNLETRVKLAEAIRRDVGELKKEKERREGLERELEAAERRHREQLAQANKLSWREIVGGAVIAIISFILGFVAKTFL